MSDSSARVRSERRGPAAVVVLDSPGNRNALSRDLLEQLQAAIAKMVSGEAAMDNARDATQVHGGYGFMNEYVVSRHYRDSKILEVGEGTTEVQLMLIARELGL